MTREDGVVGSSRDKSRSDAMRRKKSDKRIRALQEEEKSDGYFKEARGSHDELTTTMSRRIQDVLRAGVATQKLETS